LQAASGLTEPATVDALIVPGSSDRMLAKAAGLNVSEIIIDLEDAVVPARKAEALRSTLTALERGFLAHRTSVRINAPGTPWAHAELIALASATVRPDAVIVPKVGSPRDLAFVSLLLDGAETPAEIDASTVRQPIRVQALIETADGIANLSAIAERSIRLEALVIGYADLAVSLGRAHSRNVAGDFWTPIQSAVVVAARAAGLRAIDGPFLTIDDIVGLEAAAALAVTMGFDGKWAIHPTHVEPIRRVFAPSNEEIADARAVLEALASAEATGSGAVSLRGRMIDEPVRLAALRTLARAHIETS
jgi:citrate lyase subunit beta / citryl-CoA lyase